MTAESDDLRNSPAKSDNLGNLPSNYWDGPEEIDLDEKGLYKTFSVEVECVTYKRWRIFPSGSSREEAIANASKDIQSGRVSIENIEKFGQETEGFYTIGTTGRSCCEMCIDMNGFNVSNPVTQPKESA
jgi:hypothetical protein